MKKVVIIGAGPAGLAAASNLCTKKISSVILEKDSCVGGLSRTIKYRDCCFDIGSHRFFTKSKSVFNWWCNILKEDFVKVKRNSRIYYREKFFNYPLAIRNVILNLGLFNSLPIFLSYLKSRFWPIADDDSFEGWVINRFGERLYRVFFKDYTEKVWGIPCAQLSADWAAQRIKGLSLSSALRSALFKNKKNAIKTLINEFYYPRCGAGMMYEAVAEKIKQEGGQIRLNSEVVKIKHQNYRVSGLICKNTKDGSLFEVEGTDFCSSMPLNLLVSRMDPPPAEEILKNCNRLHYRSLALVYFILERKDLFRDNWIYIHSGDIRAGRISNYKNFSSDMVSDLNKSSLCLEYFCTEGDPIWCQTNEAAIELAIKELAKLKIADKKDIMDAFVLRMPNAYPVYDVNYRQVLKTIKDFINRFSNLQCIGRYGTFRYNNMDHSILTGFLAADNILGAKEDIWNINMDQSYHEELEENSTGNF